MITKPAAALAAALLTSPSLLHAEPEFRDAATQEELVAKLRDMQSRDPMKELPTATGEDPAKNLPSDLISQSDIICHGGLLTLVPKNAVVHIPQGLEPRLLPQDGARIVTWLEFLNANRNWITTIDVTLPQAQGLEPLSESTLKSIASSRSIILAFYRGSPISLLPPKEP